ncbi:dynein axonemal heavy chain 1-like [Bacillus rossius redtenbacheri]|uniref:dynein axonemal heavy chain 1-like n=1 Tax=Bacillus rossius redtenbacheri TaxID=93214 RepID=UPI002FDE9934
MSSGGSGARVEGLLSRGVATPARWWAPGGGGEGERRVRAQLLTATEADVAARLRFFINSPTSGSDRGGAANYQVSSATLSITTKCYEVLQKTMTKLKGQPSPSGQPFQAVRTFVLNPKAITLGQLYGEYDLLTREWSDGILSTLVRQGSSATDADKRWYVLDGPVDAVWIENMNTVLDDNKKLCLSSGEIIMLRPTQTMMFEVADLAVASPATVSRCGMVYMEPGMLGLQPFIDRWMDRLPKIAKKHEEQIRTLVESYLLPGLQFLRRELHELVPSVDSCLVASFQNLMDTFLLPLQHPLGKPPPPPPFQELLPALLPCWAVFSLVWSAGATCDEGSRPRFSAWLRARMESAGEPLPFPEAGLVHDYRLVDGGFSTAAADSEPQPPVWQHWMEDVQEYVVAPDTSFSDIEVPTIDTVRNASLIGTLLEAGKRVLCVGKTGAGKTVTVTSKLSRGMDKKTVCEFLIFSARTTANQTQDLIESKLDRRRKGVLGPPVMRRMVLFVDDFNMPALEVFGAQPPIELIRQWMDFRGWYDRKAVGEFTTLLDVELVAAMGPPGGGRNPVTPRLLRHFHHLAFTELEPASQMRIFGTIVRSWAGRSETLAALEDWLVRATLAVYDTVRRELLPTPARTHYTFNLRDLSKVFQGMLLAPPQSVKDKRAAIRLWFHECCRVFQDRLVDDADRGWFDALLRTNVTAFFGDDPVRVLGDKPILFGAFLEPLKDVKVYEEITDMDKLSQALDWYLEEYNFGSRTPMNLVLFLDAISHVCRIARIVRQPMGNALLLGMGGSGRRSLTKLAAHLSELPCEQVELTRSYGPAEWREDVKKLMLSAGVRRRETVFLFSDTQIKSESFLEDLNNVLNSGDVPNIYAPEDLEQIYQAMRIPVSERGLPTTKPNLFAAFQRLVSSNLHVAIAMSPIGEVFRARLRQFPALVNCCTIDWFSPWPEAALRSVALHFLRAMPDLEVSAPVLEGIVNTCQLMHRSSLQASDVYRQELSRHVYITPTSYLELLKSYDRLLTKMKTNLKMQDERLASGMAKMRDTEESVTAMQESLNKMRPELEQAVHDTEDRSVRIQKEKEDAELLRKGIEKEEAQAQIQTKRTEALADDAQRDLDAALPALADALASVRSLDKKDIAEVRSMARPPVGVRLVLESVCILKGIPPMRSMDMSSKGYVYDYWEPSKLMLVNPDFLKTLENFDKDNIPHEVIEKLNPYIENPEFRPEIVVRASKACMSLCKWVHAIYKYHFINLEVQPKKEVLRGARAQLEEMMKLLQESRRKMHEVMDRLAQLEEQLAASQQRRELLEKQTQLVDGRLKRALRLLTGLDHERRSWQELRRGLAGALVHATGDVLVTAGAAAYLGPFVDEYRLRLLADWRAELARAQVPHSPGCTPESTMGDPVVMRRWQLAGLPRDRASSESAVLVPLAGRWPLFVDPQRQAVRWITNMEKEAGLVVMRPTDKDLLRSLESAVWFGKPCLIEGVGEDLDPSLDTVLLRQVFVQGGSRVIRIGDNVVPYNDSFRLYLATKLANPSYSPEVFIKVMIINFALVPSGLQDQMLAQVVATERPDLEALRGSLVVSHHEMTEELKQLGDRILQRIASAEGQLVDDVELILMLEATRAKTEEIQVKVKEAEKTQEVIDSTRAQYIPVATRAQILFFCVSDLAIIDPMYQYSLEWFVNIFVGSMEAAEKTADTKKRIASINAVFTFDMFSNVCRSLFERHKQHFAFLLAVRARLEAGEVDGAEYRALLSGGTAPAQARPKPELEWLTTRAWNEIQGLEFLLAFKEWVPHFAEEGEKYKRVFDSTEPHREPLPSPWEDSLDDFQRLLVLKCLRPDKLVNAMQDYIVRHLGQQFVQPQTTDLESLFKDSSATAPLVFVLSAGTDPAEDFYKFVEKMNFSKRVKSISLGQGQGEKAAFLFTNAVENGNWIYFQNCHLSPSWMPELELLVQNLTPETTHKEFRLWLTSLPSPHFPISILQNSAKMTVEPPRGIQANMLRAYTNHVPDFRGFMESEDPKAPSFRLLQFALCLFHSVCLERRKFGALGFNIPYEFTDGDLRICLSQLKMFLLEYDDVPFKVLQFTAGEINYGGRVTDDWDRRCIKNLLDDFYDTKVLDEKYFFDEEAIYHQLPVDTSLAQYVSYMRTLPLNDTPAIFGLHENADISYAQQETFSCLAMLLQLQPRAVSGDTAQSQEESTVREAAAIDQAVPQPFDLPAVAARYPVMYEESLNTVLVQEIIRYNRLLVVIHESIARMMSALKGLVVMSEQLENMSLSIFNNAVPHLWEVLAYPSLKPLGAWVKDLQKRVNFIQKWIDEGVPPAFWISGFYFPQAFLTGTLQNFARKHVLSIDTIDFSFKILDQLPTERPEDGCCIYGLYLEGCRWSASQHILAESRLKELYTDMAAILLVPVQHYQKPVTGIYECPVYKTLTRAGVLSTTGHSTNYVLAIEIPSDQPQKHWIKRGVALICALDY